MIKKIVTVFFTFLCFLSYGQTFEQTGKCSYYADKFNGRKTASGERYNKNLFTAAHRTLPFNTVVQVTNLRNQKKVLVKINDRGPSSGSRIIDVSKAAAIELEMLPYGVEKVKVEVVDVPPLYLIQDTTNKVISEPVKKVEEKIPVTNEKKEKNVEGDDLACPAAGYGVQIGYYKILNNCKNQLAKFQTKYEAKGYIYKEQKTKNTYYRLVMGAYPDKKQAALLQAKLKNEIPGCFIVNWGKL